MSLQLAILPPGPELKKKIDKTASAIHTQPALREKLVGRAGFDFLLDGDDFHPYFLHRLQKAREDALHSITSSTSAAAGSSATAGATAAAAGGGHATGRSPQPQPQDSNQNQQRQNQPPQNETAVSRMIRQAAEQSYTHDPLPDEFSLPLIASGISALEMDQIQLAAQHAAVYGDDFVAAVRAKNVSQRRYEFLAPEHPKHVVFEKLRSAYVKILSTVADAVGASSNNNNNNNLESSSSLVSRLQLLAGESADNVLGDSVKARENFLIESTTKRQFMLQEDARRKSSQLSETDLRNRLNWSEFVVMETFSLDSLKLRHNK